MAGTPAQGIPVLQRGPTPLQGLFAGFTQGFGAGFDATQQYARTQAYVHQVQQQDTAIKLRGLNTFAMLSPNMRKYLAPDYFKVLGLDTSTDFGERMQKLVASDDEAAKAFSDMGVKMLGDPSYAEPLRQAFNSGNAPLFQELVGETARQKDSSRASNSGRRNSSPSPTIATGS